MTETSCHLQSHPSCGLSWNESDRSCHCLINRCPNMSGCPDMLTLPNMPTYADMPWYANTPWYANIPWYVDTPWYANISGHIKIAHFMPETHLPKSPPALACPNTTDNWYIHENAMRMVKNAKFLNTQQRGIHDVLIGRDILPFCIVGQTWIGLCVKSNIPR